jgi:LPXTG-motif cell wall-anchored protein
MDAWLKATIPNPKTPGPQPAAALAITASADGAACTAPAWTPNPTETDVPVQSSDVTWSAWLADGLAFSVTSKQGDVLSLTRQVAQAAGWWTEDKGADSKAKSFSLRCSLDAKFADLATVSTVTSTVGVARYADGKYTLGAAAGEGAGDPDAGTPAAPPAPAAGAPGSGALAATGAQPVGWIALAALVLVAGGALTVLARRRRSRS